MSKIVKVFGIEYAVNEDYEVLNITRGHYESRFMNENDEQYIVHGLSSGKQPKKIEVAKIIMYVNDKCHLPPEKWDSMKVGYLDKNPKNLSYGNLYPIYLEKIEYVDKPGYYYIPGYEQNVINEKGDVYRLKRKSHYSPYMGSANKLNLPNFYPFSRLDEVNGDERRYVHVLLGLTFKEPPEDYPNLVVDHKNGNKLDFSLENLRWVTSSQNNIVAGTEQGLKKDLIPVSVKDLSTGNVAHYKSLSEFAKTINCSPMAVIDARKRYDQTYRQRWVMKEESDSRTFEEIKNTKVITAAASNKHILAKNIITGEITSYETTMGCVRALNVNKKMIMRGLNGFAKTISNGYIFKLDDEQPWIELDEYSIEIYKRGLQPTTAVYKLTDTNTDEESIHYGTGTISELTSANERTAFMCAKYNRLYKNRYKIERLN